MLSKLFVLSAWYLPKSSRWDSPTGGQCESHDTRLCHTCTL